MHMLFSLLILIFLPVFPVGAQPQCADTRTFTSKLYDKTISLYDEAMPIFFQDPQRSIQFHLARAKALYGQAKNTVISNPGSTIRLASQGQNHLTFLEKNIRQIQNSKTVPFTGMFETMKEISGTQKEIMTTILRSCVEPLTVLMSFETRTELTIKKLYYESLLH